VKLPVRRGAVVLATSLLATVSLAACSGASKSPSSASGSSSGSSSTATTSVGVKVAGAFGQKPSLTVPKTPAPSKLTTDVLTQGAGAAVTSGQSLVVNYLGQTWAPKDGKPNVFDNSFDKHQPFAFVLGKQAVIPGWDKALVGQKAGSRLLLTIPPDLAYGTTSSTCSAGTT
jgi:peptidylprolyl isomerase